MYVLTTQSLAAASREYARNPLGASGMPDPLAKRTTQDAAVSFLLPKSHRFALLNGRDKGRDIVGTILIVCIGVHDDVCAKR